MVSDALKRCKLFDNMTDDEIASVTKDLQTTVVPTGKSVISENASGDNLYIIIKGSVAITKDLAENYEDMVAELNVLEVGNFFGEMALVDNQPRCANVISRDNVEVMTIPKDRFFSQIAYTNPKVLFNLIRTLSWRLRDTNQKFVDVMEKLIAQNRLMAIGMAASKIIHDIKTPLTVIVLTAQMLESLDPESKRFTDSIVNQTMAVNQMVLEILDFAKGNVTPINPQRINLEHFLQDINDTFGQTLSHDVEFIIQNRVTQDVWFDESKIRRVLVNLMKNSYEAMKTKGLIRLDAMIEDDHLVFIVSDNGSGLPERIKANLFNPFQTEGKSHGTGLGLAITKKLVLEHKGTIEYKPNEPQGTIFIIKLPQESIK